jgi:predicted nucleic acid-binding Zn ribbon protein
MKCPECEYQTESQNVPMEQGPPVMLCLMCAIDSNPRYVRLRRVFSAVPAVFRGGGWASKS